MPDRTLLALAAMFSLWVLPTNGNAQGLIGRSNPIRGGAPAASTAPSPYGAQGGMPGYPVPAAGYGAAPGYGAPGYPPAETAMASADPNRKLQPGDQLLLKIEQDREAAVGLMVSQTGDVNVDPIPQAIRVAGLSLSAATNEIKRELEKDYYYTATVRLTLERVAPLQASGQISISGYVNRVGMFPLIGSKPMKLSEAILQAGGIRMYGNDSKVKVTRVGKDGRADTIEVDIASVQKKGRVDKDILVQDGDQIYVPAKLIQY